MENTRQKSKTVDYRRNLPAKNRYNKNKHDSLFKPYCT